MAPSSGTSKLQHDARRRDAAAPQRPSGTVSFLFTDIEGSTSMWERHPEGMDTALARHDELLRAAIEAHGGLVFATGGDGFAAAFAGPRDAVAAAVAGQVALAAQPWDETLVLRVRMGVHTGEAMERDGDYFGPPVNRAARLMGSAHGGQIVLSDVTAGLLGSPPGVSLVDLGWHRLRGLSEPMHVFGVRTETLEWLDRPLSTEVAGAGNLPRAATEYVGSVDLLRRQAAEITGRRLVTLTGSGGVGKTRAAIEIGWLSFDSFPDGVWIVDLTPINEAELVISAVASSIGVAPTPGASMLESIVDVLSDRAELLILDNCEHVLGPAAELASAIIAGCRRVTILATSREPLRVAGERVVRVPSLEPAEAIELFRERATAADDSLSLPSTQDATIRAICERLDGIPLAIELAASRLRSLTLEDLAARLDDRFRVLRGRGGTGSERHRTMRATVDWSYQLLSDTEKVVFDRISVFAGGFDLVAAETVCADPSLPDEAGVELDPDDLVDVLSSLVDKSMVVADRSGRTVRYRLLETLRQYGRERRAERGETEPLRDRHLDHYLRLATVNRERQMGPTQPEADAVFEREWDNLRWAVGWATEQGDTRRAEELMWAVFPFAVLRMRYEVEEWALRLLARERVETPMPGRILVTAAGFAMFAAEWERSLPLCELTVERSTDPESVALAWHSATISAMMLGRPDDAREFRDRAQAALADADDPFVTYWVHYSAMAVATSIDRTAVSTWLDRLRAHAERHQAPWMFPAVHMAQGNLLLLQGDREGALESFRRMVTIASTARSMLDEGMGASRVIGAALARPDAALDDEVLEMLVRIRDTRSWTVVASACEPIANRLARDGRLVPAAVILGGLLAEPTSSHRAKLRAETIELVEVLADVDDLIARGSEMTPAELVGYTIEQLAGRGAERGEPLG